MPSRGHRGLGWKRVDQCRVDMPFTLHFQRRHHCTGITVSVQRAFAPGPLFWYPEYVRHYRTTCILLLFLEFLPGRSPGAGMHRNFQLRPRQYHFSSGPGPQYPRVPGYPVTRFFTRYPGTHWHFGIRVESRLPTKLKCVSLLPGPRYPDIH